VLSLLCQLKRKLLKYFSKSAACLHNVPLLPYISRSVSANFKAACADTVGALHEAVTKPVIQVLTSAANTGYAKQLQTFILSGGTQGVDVAQQLFQHLQKTHSAEFLAIVNASNHQVMLSVNPRLTPGTVFDPQVNYYYAAYCIALYCSAESAHKQLTKTV
jgi:hypothetical protein